MPRKSSPKVAKPKKPTAINSQNAQKLANEGLNPAFTQSHGVLVKNAEGKWEEGPGYTRTASGKLSVNGKNTKGASTWTFTPKNDDGSPVIGKNGKPRQSGRSSLATRRQREYDVKVGLNNGWMDENGFWHGGTPPEGASVQSIPALTTG